MSTNNPANGLSNEALRSLQAGLREKLLDDLKAIDPSVVGELSLKLKSTSDHFSDWHDRFNDGGRFTDGFGKAGGRVAEIKNAVGPIKAAKS